MGARGKVYDCAECVILMDKVGSLFQSSLVDVSCEIYVVLFALRPLLPARAKAERSNKGKRKEATMKVITGL